MEFVLLSILILVVIAAVIAGRMTDNGNPYPFKSKSALITQVEKSFLALLEQSVGDDYKIVSRVKLVDIIDFKSGISVKSKRTALTKAKNKQLDFVLLDKNNFNIVAAIDLVNNNNKEGHKAQKDWFVGGALESAGIPHIRMKVKAGYKASEVRQAILFKLGKKAVRQPIVKAKTIMRPAVLSPTQMKASNSTALAQI